MRREGEAERRGEGGRRIDPSSSSFLPSSLHSSLIRPPCPHPPNRPQFNAMQCTANAMHMQCNAMHEDVMQCDCIRTVVIL